MSIKRIFARQIFDSRGNPTVEVDVTTVDGLFRASVPSGASTGTHEAQELRDGDPAQYHGKSVQRALTNINEVIGPRIMDRALQATQQREIDDYMRLLDGTDTKRNLGANAILGISAAIAKAGAAHSQMPLCRYLANYAAKLRGESLSKVEESKQKFLLPVPGFNVINGGQHAGNRMAFQEFMILPTGASSFAEAMRMGTEVYHHLKAIIKDAYGLDATCVGDEGGFAPPKLNEITEALDLIVRAISAAKLTGKIEIAIDAAASEMYKNGKYDLDFKNSHNPDSSKWLTGSEMIQLYKELVNKYPIIILEDPLNQEDEWENWAKLTKELEKIQIIGDDLTCTNKTRIQKAIDGKACNGLLLKINQIGTITESIEAFNQVKQTGWCTMVSHRSGDTEESFIADLVVGLGTGLIKAGAPCRSERLTKYNQLLRIEEQLGPERALYGGKHFRAPDLAKFE